MAQTEMKLISGEVIPSLTVTRLHVWDSRKATQPQFFILRL